MAGSRKRLPPLSRISRRKIGRSCRPRPSRAASDLPSAPPCLPSAAPASRRPIPSSAAIGPRGVRHAKRAEPRAGRPPRRAPREDVELVRYRIEVGHEHGVQPGNIVGAIANEAGIDAVHIGRIEIFDSHSLVGLPGGMPKEIFQRLRKVWVCGQQLAISVDSGGDVPKRPPPGIKAKRKTHGPKRKTAHD